MTAMIVEDDARMRAMLADLCSPLFSVIAEFGDGGPAVDAYRDCRTDYVLMDILLPGMDGIEATRRITEHDSAARVFVVSACSEPVYRELAKRAGARGFFPKEDLGALVAALRADADLLR